MIQRINTPSPAARWRITLIIAPRKGMGSNTILMIEIAINTAIQAIFRNIDWNA
jgi:hypothetical protein